MKQSRKKIYGIFICRGLYVSVFFICCLFLSVHSSAAELKGIFSGSDPSSLRLQVSERIPIKVILVDDTEVLIALKNVQPANSIELRLNDSELFRKVELETLSGNVIAVLVTGKKKFHEPSFLWDEKGLNLLVSFDGKLPHSSSYPSEKSQSSSANPSEKKAPGDILDNKPDSKDVGAENKVPDQKQIDTSPENKGESDATTEKRLVHETPKPRIENRTYGSPDNVVVGKAGDISDIVSQVDLIPCSDKEFKKALIFLKQFQWQSAYELLNGYIENGQSSCAEKAELLRAYAYYKTIDDKDYNALLQAEALFQAQLVKWPDSDMIPFCYTALGLISGRLDNIAAAEGYLTIVMDEYPDYSGMPEVLYHIAKTYDEKNYNEKALENYQVVFEKYPDSIYAVDAGVGLGKALFKKRHYIDSRDILTGLLKTNPEIMYDSPDVLLSIGDAEFALGRNEPSRDALGKAYNLFADIPDKDMVMTRIADTYANEKKMERARKVYEFVMDKFPGTEGFLGSAMGLALCLKEREKIEELYTMVKNNFADHRLSRVAMMRLAELYNNNGEYEKCIEEIERLLATHPTGLRYDAVRLMQKAYESLFDEKLKTGQYPEVLRTYEGAKVLLDRLESRNIFLSTGLSYLDGHLYGQAYNQLLKAYKEFPESDRPIELVYGIAIAMDETDRDDEALNHFKSYTAMVEEGPEKVEAFIRMGDIYFKKGDLVNSEKHYEFAYSFSRDRIEKARILNREAEVYRQEKKWDKVAELLERAVVDYASAPGENYDLISEAYKTLGKAYLEKKTFVKAAEAFTMALKFSDDAGRPGSDITFMLGDAYQKANAIDKAKEAFEKIAEDDDSIWSRLARERLSTLTLAETLSNS
ncbi:TPR repeat family protein [Desulfamplus magnetovallimortis]|uniref:TPR repeat family protein n=1 Tax=Desulfamplus magnetovallimortis TaxID=1246637 RepID=A0A1W1HA03_9BACT|nr:tetratricopeptide repeat protein [Desulfamplus magnetovallimortis]SLM29266.1 TPR repeat family protein [Desulfamplus magnetovallimortis]